MSPFSILLHSICIAGYSQNNYQTFAVFKSVKSEGRLYICGVFLQMGFTPIHIAAKFGHSSLIDKFAKTNVNVRQISRKTGMSALHIAAYYGEEGNEK